MKIEGGEIMKRINIKRMIITALEVGAFFLISCSGYNMLVRMPEVKEVPDVKYERIIKLYNPEGSPGKTLVALVLIKQGARVCTNYPREEIIKSLDDLTVMEKNAYRFFSHYEIKEDGRIYGFVSVPLDYNVLLWKDEKNEDCKYKVQVDSINKDRDTLGETIPSRSPGGFGH